MMMSNGISPKGGDGQCTCGDLIVDKACILLQIEQDEYLETFTSYRNRYHMDYEPSYSSDPLYYSVEVGREP